MTRKKNEPCPCDSPCEDLELLRSELPGLPRTELQRRLELPAACLSAQHVDVSSPTPLCRLDRDLGMC